VSARRLVVHRYHPDCAEEWGSFVRSSKNGTFLFERAYMDYHSDRFTDHSLVVRDERDRVVALLPASVDGDVLTSHAGLTYGGFVTDSAMTAPLMLTVFDAVQQQLVRDGARRLRYKTVPHIYHHVPAEEDRYALFRAGAVLVRSDVLSVIDYRDRLPYQERRRRGVRKASDAGVKVDVSDDLPAFWDVLTDALRRHETVPVHDLSEITLLTSRFPKRIVLHAARQGSTLVAGVLAYLTEAVCHLQYIAVSQEGRAVGALDAAVDHAIETYADSHRWFDFGISTELGGRQLNAGLVEQKEGFGARSVVHDTFELDLRAPDGSQR
jgi:hypothetical protein